MNLNQTEFSNLMGVQPDTFLSAAFCGYFFTLDTDKRMEVLRSVVPPIDRTEVLRSLLDPEQSYEGLDGYLTASKRSDLEISRVAATRRDLEIQVSNMEGEAKGLSDGMPTWDKPKPVFDEQRLEVIESHMQEWARYRFLLKSYEETLSKNEDFAVRLQSWEKEYDTLKTRLNELPPIAEDNVEKYLDLSQKLADTEGGLKKHPPIPASLQLPDGDRCMACGQVIGVKHRETLKEDLARERAKHQQACILIDKENEETRNEIEALKIAVELEKARQLQVRDENSKIKRTESLLKEKMQTLESQKPRSYKVDEKPVEPAVKYESLKSEMDALLNSKAEVNAYNDVQRRQKRIESSIEGLQEKCQKFKASIESLRAIEAAYKILDEKVFEIQKPQYELRDGYSIELSDKSVTVVNNMDRRAYEVMSTGERIRASAYLCEKISSCLGGRVPFLFIDNADLVDSPIEANIPQIFLVYVNDGSGPFRTEEIE